jgi:hypothetical protein
VEKYRQNCIWTTCAAIGNVLILGTLSRSRCKKTSSADRWLGLEIVSALTGFLGVRAATWAHTATILVALVRAANATRKT